MLAEADLLVEVLTDIAVVLAAEPMAVEAEALDT
jgi:hypothetical protein